jgi:hypothetical protein
LEGLSFYGGVSLKDNLDFSGLDLMSHPDSEIREALGKANAAIGMRKADPIPKSGKLF